MKWHVWINGRHELREGLDWFTVACIVDREHPGAAIEVYRVLDVEPKPVARVMPTPRQFMPPPPVSKLGEHCRRIAAARKGMQVERRS